jgi:hypothetical protein
MNTTEKKFDITPFKPCRGGLNYYSGKASFEEAWRNCERGDWMLWIAAKLNIDSRLLTKATAMCANTVRHLMKDSRSADAVDAALRYANGEIGEDELEKYKIAALAAEIVAFDAVNSVNANAVNANAANANAAKTAAKTAAVPSAAYAADVACDVACAAACAADYYTDAYAANQLKTANICREVLTEAVLEKVNQSKNQQS